MQFKRDMKKLVVKTSLITLGVTLILLLSVFGVLSLCVPYKMSDFTNAIGLETLSGDYAYQEYERSGDVEYLARSFEIAARHGGARKADERFGLLIAHEKFDELCAKRDEAAAEDTATPRYRYRDYVYGHGACVKYRLAKTETERRRVCEFAVAQTDEAFEAGNPVIWLTVEAVGKKDGAFCALLLEELEHGGRSFNKESEDYKNIVKYLEGANE